MRSSTATGSGRLWLLTSGAEVSMSWAGRAARGVSRAAGSILSQMLTRGGSRGGASGRFASLPAQYDSPGEVDRPDGLRDVQGHSPGEGEQLFEAVQTSTCRARRAAVWSSSINSLEADTAEVQRSIVGSARSAHAEFAKCYVGEASCNVAEISGGLTAGARIGDATFRGAGVALLRSETATCDRSAMAVVAASRANCRGGLAGVVAAQEVAAERIRALVVLSPRIEGSVTMVLSMGRALAFGAAFAVASYLLRRLFDKE